MPKGKKRAERRIANGTPFCQLVTHVCQEWTTLTLSGADFPTIGEQPPPEPQEKESDEPSQFQIDRMVEKIEADYDDEIQDKRRNKQQVRDLLARNEVLTRQVRKLSMITNQKKYHERLEKLEARKAENKASSEQNQLAQRTVRFLGEDLKTKQEELDEAIATVTLIESTIHQLNEQQELMKRGRNEFIANRSRHKEEMIQMKKKSAKDREKNQKKMDEQIVKLGEELDLQIHDSTTALDKINAKHDEMTAEMMMRHVERIHRFQQKITDSSKQLNALCVKSDVAADKCRVMEVELATKTNEMYKNFCDIVGVPSEFECPVCMDFVPSKESITCRVCNACVCDTCFTDHLLSKTPLKEVDCAVCKADIPIHVLSSHVSDEAFDTIHRRIMDVESQKVAKVEVDMAIKHLTEMSKIDRYTEHISEQALTLRCAKCKTAVCDWEACNVVGCDNCKVKFCGICFAFHGNSESVHEHVLECSGSSRSYFSSQVELAAIHSKLKCERVKEYLKTLDEETSQTVFENCMEKTLFEGNISPADMSTFRWLPDTSSPEPEMVHQIYPVVQILLDIRDIFDEEGVIRMDEWLRV